MPNRPPPPPAVPGPPTAEPVKLLLIYAPEGALGGTFTCTRCGASALQPALLSHAQDCPYATTPPIATPATR